MTNAQMWPSWLLMLLVLERWRGLGSPLTTIVLRTTLVASHKLPEETWGLVRSCCLIAAVALHLTPATMRSHRR